MAGRKFQIGNVSLYIVKKDYSFSVFVDDIKWDPIWKLLNKEVDLGEAISFLDHENLVCTQRQCQISKVLVDNYRTMLESRISAGGTEKLPFPQNLRIFSWSYERRVMQRNVWSDIVSWPIRRRNNSTKYLFPASMTTTSKKKKRNLLENCHKYAPNLF